MTTRMSDLKLKDIEPDSQISIYDRMCHSDAELCALLAQGDARRELTAIFGAADYTLLTALARAAQNARLRHAEPVYILPGIMGTQLGALRAAGAPADLLWLDPQDVIGGALTRLRLPATAGLVSLGAIPFSYLALQLRLRAGGFNVVMHDYDWRQSLEELATAFAARLRADAAPGILIVAHSMGGLIARHAMQDPALVRVRRLITLGTPHRGSFGAVQAIRGTYPVVRRLAALDRHHDADFLAAQVFSTFPSIHQLLPAPGLDPSIDLLVMDNWPTTGPRPDPDLLAAARAFVATLTEPDARCIAISGTHQRTVVGLRLAAGEFHYRVGDAGDGTVPLASAQLAHGDNYYVRCEHSALPRSAAVGHALVELLRHGRTTRLAATPGRPLGREVMVSDSELRTTWNDKLDWAQLGPVAHRDYLNRLNQSPPQYSARRTRGGRDA